MALIEIFNVSTSRICYPKWFKFRNDISENTEFEEDYLKYREELVINIFANLLDIPKFKDIPIKLLGQALSSIKPGSSTP
jgi:hypothetical protein